MNLHAADIDALNWTPVADFMTEYSVIGTSSVQMTVSAQQKNGHAGADVCARNIVSRQLAGTAWQ